MPALAPDAQQPLNPQFETKVVLPPPQYGNGVEEEDLRVESRYLGPRLQITAPRQHSVPPRARALLVLLAAFAVPLLTTLILLAVCKSPHSVRKQALGMNRRRLADKDESAISIVEECLALEEELGLVAQEVTPPVPTDRSRRISELALLFSETAAAHEAMQGQEEAWGVQQAYQPAAPLAYWPTNFGYQQEGSPAASEEQLSTFTSAAASPAASPVAYEAKDPSVGPAFDPDMWADILEVIGSQPEWDQQEPAAATSSSTFEGIGYQPEWVQQEPAAATSSKTFQGIGYRPEWDQQEPAAATSSSTFTPEEQQPEPPAPMDVYPSTSGESSSTRASVGRQLPLVTIDTYPTIRGALQAGVPALEHHPYYRLPVLAPGVVVDTMLPEGVMRPIKMNISSYAQFATLRRLFAKPVLNQDDADEAMVAIEKLVRKTARRARRGIRQVRPLFGASTLGSYFLVFDYLVSALQVFGGSSGLPEWWGEFVSVFDFDYFYPTPSKGSRESGIYNTQLANSLLVALNMYKKGERPSAHVVIELKRHLFFGEHGPQQFKRAQWDPWREEDEAFRRARRSYP
ncbi:hypothetical protein, conserved [Eimeria brunetti]|uniref:Uncharacterized protein n=1 Tax=Eimeria brunetti TaxID=51314 RepID=U6LNE9_9EIME|nr:hypothetical protein, conserved [Eimeria brunetti]